MDQSLFLGDRRQWRVWLKNNHTNAIEVWVVFYKKATSKSTMSLGEAVEEALCFGWIDGKLKKRDQESYIIRFSPRKSNSVWSKINKERAERLIAEGKMTPAGLKSIEVAKKTGAWENAYTNKNLEEVPPDLKEALMQNQVAWKNFIAFANTYKNLYVGWINQAKTSQTRKGRIDKVVEQSLKNKKQIFL